MSRQDSSRMRPMGRRGRGPMGHMGAPVEKAKNFKVSFKRLVGYLKPHRRNLIIVFIFAIASTAFAIAAPKVSGKAINKLQDGYMSKTMIDKISEGQMLTYDAIVKNFSDSQQKSKKQIIDSMADLQKKARDNIILQMEEAKKVQNNLPVEPKALSEDLIKATQDFMALPEIKSLPDNESKIKTIEKMLILLGKIPGNNENENITPEALAGLIQMINLPDISEEGNINKKIETINKIIDLSSGLEGLIELSEEEKTGEVKFDKESIENLKEYLNLPIVNTLDNGRDKAGVVKEIMDFGEKIKDSGVSFGSAEFGSNGDIEFTQEQIDGAIEAIEETNGEYDFKYIGMIALYLIGMYILSACFTLAMGLVMSGVSQKTVRDMRREVDMKLEKLPLKYYDAHPHGDILSRVSNDIDTISTTLQQSLTQIITSVTLIVGYVIMMVTISWTLTLIVIATLPLYVFATIMLAKRSQKYFAKQQKELGDLSGHVEEMYTGHKIVKSFGHEKDAIKHFDKVNDKLYKAGWKAQFISGIMFPVMNFISNIGYVMICMIGGLWITKNILKIGDILAFIQYSRSFTMPIVQTANIANIIQSTVACAERVFELLDEEEEIPDSDLAVVIDKPKGEVVFEKVKFRYKEDVPLIDNMNIEVKSGDTIAIVGPTGAGKTTLVNLLMRFYEINGGKVKIDGVDIKDIKRSDLRKMFGMVLQDTWLFNGTIRDNIAYGKKDATIDEVVSVAKAAYADHFIRTLPDGYYTILNEEASNISQGQKQLITIARALLANPAILILDEATSSVDTRTEVLIQKAVDNLMKNRTSFVIAHRLSTIRDAKTILVMNQGKIIEMGNHKELLNKKGFYFDLYDSQFNGNSQKSQVV